VPSCEQRQIIFVSLIFYHIVSFFIRDNTRGEAYREDWAGQGGQRVAKGTNPLSNSPTVIVSPTFSDDFVTFRFTFSLKNLEGEDGRGDRGRLRGCLMKSYLRAGRDVSARPLRSFRLRKRRPKDR